MECASGAYGRSRAADCFTSSAPAQHRCHIGSTRPVRTGAPDRQRFAPRHVPWLRKPASGNQRWCCAGIPHVLLMTPMQSSVSASAQAHSYYYATDTYVRALGTETRSQTWEACMMPLHYVRCCMPTRHASPDHALQLAAPNLQQVAECVWGGWRHDTTATCVRLRVEPTTRNGSGSAFFCIAK